MPNLYLIPTPIAEGALDSLSPRSIEITRGLDHFIVERAKTARQHLKLIDHPLALPTIKISELDKHQNYEIDQEAKEWISNKVDIGLLSEAGCPCIADPGYHVVDYARQRGYVVTPLVGPNSILLALMASGMQGQLFTFHGYLPIREGALRQKLRKIEQGVKEGYTQAFIETPYRNTKTMQAVCKHFAPQTKVCFAENINSNTEKITVLRCSEWIQKIKKSPLEKVPAIFLIG